MSAIAPARPPGSTHPATRSQLAWLASQLPAWQGEGLVDQDQASRILDRYHADSRFRLARLLLTLGAVFVGIGLIWLVAANINALDPTVRFAAACALWLGFLISAELLASRKVSPPVVGALRLMAALSFGAVIFQAAQTLQVPAYEPALVGWWALGALLHAYAVRAVLPLVVSVATGTTWFVWQVAAESESGLAAVVCVMAIGVVAVSVAAIHTRWLPELGEPWREVGALLVLGGLFAAALPWVDVDSFEWTTALVAGLVAAGVLAAIGLAVPGETRFEVLGAVTAAGAAAGLVLWEAGDSSEVVTGTDVAHAAVSVVTYVVAAVAVAVVGALRESWRLTALATAALVVFTTVQSFAVFAQILQGAWLFVALGVIFLGTGFAFDRARRKLVEVVTDETDGAGR